MAQTLLKRDVFLSSARPMQPAEAPWHSLNADVDLRYLPAACLPLRRTADGCDACRTACPVNALLFTDRGLALHDDCLGCGRCAAACPMGALDLPAARPQPPETPAAGMPLDIDCRRVPDRLRAATSVSCLGALDAAALLELRAQAGERGIRLLDRGWCQDCPAGGGPTHPAQAAVDTSSVHLRALGMAPERWPQLSAQPLPREAALPILPASAAKTMTRRAFFGRPSRPERLVVQTHAPVPSTARVPRAVPAHPSLARHRLLAALSALAQRLEPASAASVSHRLVATDRCRDHQGCVGICPTGALEDWREGDTGGVRFTAAECIGCGLCARHCPEGALHVIPLSENSGKDCTEAHLTRHTYRPCSACGSECRVDATDDATPLLCDPCAKSRRLAGEVFRRFFGARA